MMRTIHHQVRWSRYSSGFGAVLPYSAAVFPPFLRKSKNLHFITFYYILLHSITCYPPSLIAPSLDRKLGRPENGRPYG